MAHHSSSMDPRFASKIADLMNGAKDKFSLGPTGQFPEGKLTDTDEGETLIGITHTDGKVVIDFGKPTAWIGFTADQADGLADTLRKHAAALRV